jgi:hypothetical protein
VAFVLNDRVKETTTTTGTGTINLAGAATGFETFVAGIGNSNVTYYCIAGQGTAEFEVGIGTVTDASPDTLSRTTILSSTNSDSAVDFSAGTKDVFCTLPASKTIREFDTALNVPTGTTAQRASSPVAGDLRFNTTSSKFEGYSGSAWGNVGEGNFLVTNIFAGDGSDTTFTISNAVSGEQQLMVFIDGVFQAHDTYTVSGTTVTFSTAPANGRVITIYSALNNVQGSNMVLASMTGDNSDTTLALGVTPTSENAVQVYIDGTYQNKDTYSISGQTLTFSTAPPTGVAVEAITHTITDISAAASNILVDEFTGDGSDTTFTLSAAPTNENNTQVFVGGVYQEKATYSISNAVLTFSTAPANGVSIEVVSIAVGQINSAVQLADADGDTKVMVEESSDEDKIRFDTGGTERAIIDSTGWGIGTSSPASNLHLSATGEARLIVEGDSDNDSGEESALIEFKTDGGAVRHRVEALGSGGNDLKLIAGSTDTSSSVNSNIIFETKAASASATEAMRIDSSGKIGIGTSSPADRFQVNHTGVQASSIRSSATNNDAYFAVGNSDMSDFILLFGGHSANDSSTIGFDDGNNLRFATYQNHTGTFGTERMRIDSSGNVGIGTTSPADILHLVNAAPILKVEATNDSSGFRVDCLGQSSGQAFRVLKDTTTTLFTVDISGNVTAAGSISDERLKENISLIDNPLDKIKELKGITYKLKESGYIGTGLIAQDLQKVLPEAVYEVNEPEKNDESYLAISYGNTVGLLVESIKEQQELIETQQTTINDLKSRIETLEG